MGDEPEAGQERTRLGRTEAGMSQSEVDAWFVREVLPLEASLMQYLAHNWENKSEIPDLRQEIYARVC